MKWETPSVPAKSKLSITEDGLTVHCGAGTQIRSCAFSQGKWWPDDVATDGKDLRVREVPEALVNGRMVGEGKLIEARVGDSHTVFILTQQPDLVQVNEEKTIGEITRMVVSVNKDPAGK